MRHPYTPEAVRRYLKHYRCCLAQRKWCSGARKAEEGRRRGKRDVYHDEALTISEIKADIDRVIRRLGHRRVRYYRAIRVLIEAGTGTRPLVWWLDRFDYLGVTTLKASRRQGDRAIRRLAVMLGYRLPERRKVTRPAAREEVAQYA